MGYTDLVVDTKGLYSAYTAPEDVCNFSRDKWLDEFRRTGLTLLLGEGKQHPLSPSRYLIYWFVGTDEYWYYVTLDLEADQVTVERKSKAQKGGGAAP